MVKFTFQVFKVMQFHLGVSVVLSVVSGREMLCAR